MAEPSEQRNASHRAFLRDALVTAGLLVAMTLAAAAMDQWHRLVFLLFGVLYTVWIGMLLLRLHRRPQPIERETQKITEQASFRRDADAADTSPREQDVAFAEPQPKVSPPAGPQADSSPMPKSPSILYDEFTNDLFDTPEDQEYLKQLVGNYLDSLAGEVLSIREAIDSRNYAHAETQAHRLKGSAAMYGLPEISEVAGLLESAVAEKQDAELLQDLLEMLQTATDSVLSDGGKSHRESWNWSKM